MANSALHAIAIEELRHTDPVLHAEYWKLVKGITNLVQKIAKNYPNELEYTSFTESYDRASAEPVLQVVIGLNKNETFVHIYINKEKHFVVGKSGDGKIANTADQAMEFIEEILSTAKVKY
jgi:uncharacterized protein YpmB